MTSYQLQKQLIEESQFYIVRSSNAENIQKSKNKSIWATTIANSYKLNQAFNKGKVILFFSVGNTQYFKGYAIMTSSCAETPSNDIWQLDKNKNIKLGGDFSVYWLCYCELPFLKTKNLNINKSRDCTELEQNIGKQLFELCYAQEKEELDKNPQRIKIEINEQIISKINDTINNSKNKQNEKLNNNNINNNKIQQGNEQNKVQTNTNINNNEQNNIQIQPPNPQMTYPPNYYQYYFAYPKQIMYMPYQIQKNLQGVNNQNNNNMNDMQQQKEKKQENEKKENKKEKEKEKEKKKSRHSRKRSRSRDRYKRRSRSSSRSTNKNRSLSRRMRNDRYDRYKNRSRSRSRTRSNRRSNRSRGRSRSKNRSRSSRYRDDRNNLDYRKDSNDKDELKYKYGRIKEIKRDYSNENYYSRSHHSKDHRRKKIEYRNNSRSISRSDSSETVKLDRRSIEKY